jgi:glycosyltransferase involved in cell wall biosynthesis
MTIGLLSNSYYRRVPTVISVDATPMNIDSLAAAYRHHRQPKLVEAVKRLLVSRALSLGGAFVSWSEWAKQSLVKDYGVAAEKVLVVAPGTDIGMFRKAQPRRPGPARILFVGGDFIRKGGDVLLEAFHRRLRGKAELHLVTGYPVPSHQGVYTYHGLGPNSEALVDLFSAADIFALPTRADCLAVVLGEAMASSLPIVTTSIGAHPEAVVHGRNGLIVEPGDVESLADALECLVEDPALCRRVGEQGRALAEERFDAHRNALRVVELMQNVSAGSRCAG